MYIYVYICTYICIYIYMYIYIYSALAAYVCVCVFEGERVCVRMTKRVFSLGCLLCLICVYERTCVYVYERETQRKTSVLNAYVIVCVFVCVRVRVCVCVCG